MNYNLNEIFKSITPDNIKDIAVISDVMKIFSEILEERSKESMDISKYLDNRNVKIELFKTYLGDLYEVLDGLKNNQKMDEMIENRNAIYQGSDPNYQFISRKILDDMIDHISEEHYVAFRNFRENKGTIKGVEYAFELISSLVNTPEDIQYVVLEGVDPFDLAVDGTLPYEFYHYMVAPLAHPAGFTLNYSRTMELELLDHFFPVDITYKVNNLEVICKKIDAAGALIRVTDRTDLSDREVIRVEKIEHHWPRLLRVYFGGSHEGEYLESMEYFGGEGTVVIKDANGDVIKSFNCDCDGCTMCIVESNIEIKIVRRWLDSPTHDTDFFTEVWWYLIDYVNDYQIGKVFTDVEPMDWPTPYLSWDKVPFWDEIGSVSYNKPDWETEEFYDDHEIGAEHAYIGAKLEDLREQNLREVISPNIDDRINSFEVSRFAPKVQNLFGKTTFKGLPFLLTKPHEPNLDEAYISGDAYSVNFIEGALQNDEFGRGYWDNTFHQFSDDLGFQVFRGTTLLTDNNQARLQTETNSKTPYLSWEKPEFWKNIGDFTEESNGETEFKIGDESLYVRGKLELMENQSLREKFNYYIYDRNDPTEDPLFMGPFDRSEYIYYGKTTYKGKLALLTDPYAPNLKKAHISGDAYHITYMDGEDNTLDSTPNGPGVWYNAFSQHSDSKNFGFKVFRGTDELLDNNVIVYIP